MLKKQFNREEELKMEQGMQEYLKKVAIMTKIENFKEFDKSKEETVQAIMKNFQLPLEEANFMVERYWNSESLDTAEGEPLSEKLEYLKQKRRCKSMIQQLKWLKML